MKQVYRLFGWNISPYSQKVLSYLQYKNIPHVIEAPNLYQLFQTIQKNTKARVIPVLLTPKQEWVQDSRVIINKLEKEFPEHPVFPRTPVHRFTSCLIECWSDEVWPAMAMHTRWSFPKENLKFFENEVGRILLPWFPRFVQTKSAGLIATNLRKIMGAVGVRSSQLHLLDAWTTDMLNNLEIHFQSNQFLLGTNEPSIADFSLVGWFHAHLNYDPWPIANLMSNRPYIKQWESRMFSFQQQAKKSIDGDSPNDGSSASVTSASAIDVDSIPVTLKPILRTIANEFIPQLQAILLKLEIAMKSEIYQKGGSFPRRLGDVGFPIGPNYNHLHHESSNNNKNMDSDSKMNATTTQKPLFYREALPFTLWKAQLVLDDFHAMKLEDQEKVIAFCKEHGLYEFLELKIPRLEHDSLRVKLVK